MTLINIPAWSLVPTIIGSILITALILTAIFLANFYFGISFLRLKNDKNFAKYENEKYKNTPWRKFIMQTKKERIVIKSKDNLNLVGYFIKGVSQDDYAILVHGYHGRYYSLDRQAMFFHNLGFNILMINHRGHDESDGKYTTLGYKERDDVKRWINEVIKRNSNAKILLFGSSMGAFVVMNIIGKKAPKNIKAAIEDSGYFSIYDELYYQTKVVAKVRLAKVLMFLANIKTRIVNNFSIKLNAKESLGETNIPLLLIHGGDDDYVPVDTIDKCYEAINPLSVKKKVIFPLAGHLESYSYYPEEYEQIIKDFIKDYFEL